MRSPFHPSRATSFTIVVLSLFAAHSASAQIELSGRIGPVIDSLTREYFGLFPRLRGFRSAQVERAGGGFLFRIVRGGDGDTTITVTEATLGQLRHYVDRYEEVVVGSSPLDTAVLPYARPWRSWGEGSTITVAFPDGSMIKQRLLYADERGLVLLDNDAGAYSPLTLPHHVANLHRSGIRRVIAGGVAAPIMGAVLAAGGAVPSIVVAGADHRPVGVTLALPAGLLSGILINRTFGPLDVPTEDSSSWSSALPALRRESMFFAVTPPELRKFLDTAEREVFPLDLSMPRPTFLDRISLSAGLTSPTSGEIHTYEITGGTPGTGSVEVHDALGWSAELSYLVSSTTELSLVLQHAIGHNDGDEASYESLSRTDVAVLVNLLLTPRRPSGPQISEVLVGVGAGVVLADMEGRIASPSGKGSQVVTQQSLLPLVLGRLTYRVNVLDWMAVQTSLIVGWTGTVNTGDYAYYYPNIDGVVRTALPHAYSLSELTALVGLRFRMP